MAASHKLQHASIEVLSDLSGDQLLALAEEVAMATRGIGKYRKSPKRIAITARGGNRLACAVANENKTRLRFEVTASTEQLDDGPLTTLRTGITEFRTRQDKMLGLIPSGPKELLDYHFYERFMLNLEEAVEGRDPAATVQITERA
jgi:hypothetical protein